jgi:Cation transporter/ATPase, N-terminus
MKNVMQYSPEDVVEGHNSSLTDGLSAVAISSLSRIHGPNKLEGEAKVRSINVFGIREPRR